MPRVRLLEVMPVRNALKAVGAALAVIALCGPLIFWPVDDAGTTPTELYQATVTVPPVAVVATTLAPGETTSTTKVAAEPTSTTTTTEPPISITIAAVGDILPHESILESVKEDDWYKFWPVFAPVAPYLRAADFTVGNLETRFAGAGAGYSGYPAFNSPGILASVLRSAGFDLLATANNHSMDQGWEGVVNTLDQLDMAAMKHVGTYRSAGERATPLVVDIQGVDVGFLNYTQYLNGFTVPAEHEAYGVNLIDIDKVAQDAALARMWGADIVIALIHYGDEYTRDASDVQRAISGEIFSRGVDVILGAHSHMVQPIDHVLSQNWKVSDKYVAYSLGNFVSAQRWRYSDSGVIAYVHITKNKLRTYVTGVSYLPVYVQRSTEQVPVRYRILPVFPGLAPVTDATLTEGDKQRMSEVWEEMRDVLYRPDEHVTPLNPADLGL
jgi:poly-gamma-glutamate capsule biosynthesis protein CapA/YwtB (metallophosphatase superfamily)